MLSHHAPPRRLLQNFLSGATPSDSPSLWAYMKARAPRRIFKLRSESAEHAYFKGDPDGRTEEQIDSELNDLYEAPFNLQLPALCSGLVNHLDQSLVNICADYMANLFLRSKPMREANRLHSARFNQEFNRRLEDDLTLRRYAAKVSLGTLQSVMLSEVKVASERFLTDQSQAERLFFQFATTDFSRLPKNLKTVHWALCYSALSELLQSDAAVAMLNRAPEQGSHTNYGDGIMKANSQWFLPISARYALRASPSYYHNTVLSLRDANEINEFLIRAAYQSVYSTSAKPLLQNVVDENIYTLRFFEDLIHVDVKEEVNMMLSGLLERED